MSRKSSKTNKKQKRTPRDIFLGSVILFLGIGILIIALFFVFSQSNSKANEQYPLDISVFDSFDLYQTNTLFLDVREKSEWNEYHIPKSIHIPLGELEKRAKELPKDKHIVVVCRSGNRSQEGRNILLNKGFNQVTSMNGGIKAWQAAGYPLASGD